MGEMEGSEQTDAERVRGEGLSQELQNPKSKPSKTDGVGNRGGVESRSGRNDGCVCGGGGGGDGTGGSDGTSNEWSHWPISRTCSSREKAVLCSLSGRERKKWASAWATAWCCLTLSALRRRQRDVLVEAADVVEGRRRRREAEREMDLSCDWCSRRACSSAMRRRSSELKHFLLQHCRQH